MLKQTIALVDDDRNILTSLSIALEKEGFNVQTYIDGESALVGLSRTPPDLAVIDIKMPKMDGEELLKKLRKKTSMPVIFLTSKDDEVDELLGLKLGADDFIKKSGGFSIKVLIERVRVQLRKKDADTTIEENKNIILIEDLISTGGSSIKAVEAIKDAGSNVLAVLSIFNYGFNVSTENFNKIKCNAESIFYYRDLLEVALANKYISENELLKLKSWRENPGEWK